MALLTQRIQQQIHMNGESFLADVHGEQHSLFKSKHVDCHLVLFFELWKFADGHRELDAFKVQFVFIGLVMGYTVRLILPVNWVEGCQNTPQESLVVVVFDVHDRFLVF